MNDLSSLFEIVGLVDCAVLKHHSNHKFTVLYAPKSWFSTLFPGIDNGHNLTIAKDHAFIHDFVFDAQEFWQSQSGTQLNSGIWTEEFVNKVGNPKLLRLECIAAIANNQHFLLISNAQTAYQQKQQTLQIAREMLLSHDKMQAQHDFLSQKLQSVIQRNATVLDLHLPVEQAIQNADIGVIILDDKLVTLFCNSAAHSYFELEPGQTNTPASVVKQLISSQYPESKTLFESDKSWNGELHWQCSPDIQKWLQASIEPVINRARTISHWVITLSDTTRLKFLLQKNEDLALKDVLTGLPNRQYLWRKLEVITHSKQCVNLLFLDVVRFKRINELYGHVTGDKLLKDIASRLLQISNYSIEIARVGSARFAIIQSIETDNVANLQRDKAQQLCEAIQQRLSIPFLTDKETTYSIESMIGIATYPHDAINAELLIKAADMAITELRTDEIGKIKFYSQAMSDSNEYRLRMEEKLKHALANEEFRVLLQPILDTQSERVVKAEALLRWTTAQGESISPEQFIPLAEHTGLIIPLGNWVIKQVCRLLAFMREKDINIKLSINLSPKQVSDKYLFDFIQTTTKQSGIDAKRLELELTEGVLIDDYDKASALLSALRDMGVSIAIDDFGTGYSSLSYLKHLPIDYLKIDRSFVRDLDLNDDDRAIVLAIIAMAKQLKLSVIAEGVETDKQKNFLKEHDCQAVQGFYFSHPLTADEFFKFYKTQNAKADK
jgi:diguanylate cyclase (GGDEF)-like protein